jgi:hypothetical protein
MFFEKSCSNDILVIIMNVWSSVEDFVIYFGTTNFNGNKMGTTNMMDYMDKFHALDA